MYVDTSHEKLQRYTVQSYGSVAELVAAVWDTPMREAANRNAQESIKSGADGYSGRGAAWYGVENVAAVVAAVREGWRPGADKVDALYGAVQSKLPRAIDYTRGRARSDQGDTLDIHAVNRGDMSRAWESVRRNARYGSGLVWISAPI